MRGDVSSEYRLLDALKREVRYFQMPRYLQPIFVLIFSCRAESHLHEQKQKRSIGLCLLTTLRNVGVGELCLVGLILFLLQRMHKDTSSEEQNVIEWTMLAWWGREGIRVRLRFVALGARTNKSCCSCWWLLLWSQSSRMGFIRCSCTG